MNRLRHRIQIAGATGVLAAGVTACGSSSPSKHTTPAATGTTSAPAPAPPVSATTIKIQGYAFHPANIELLPGAKVTFVNQDQTNHTATEKAGPAKFDTGTLGPGKRMTVVLRKPGSYTYYCVFHAFMVAHLTVVKK